MPKDPKSAKKDGQVKQLFALLGSVPVKAARKQVGKTGALSKESNNNFIHFNFSSYQIRNFQHFKKKKQIVNLAKGKF